MVAKGVSAPLSGIRSPVVHCLSRAERSLVSWEIVEEPQLWCHVSRMRPINFVDLIKHGLLWIPSTRITNSENVFRLHKWVLLQFFVHSFPEFAFHDNHGWQLWPSCCNGQHQSNTSLPDPFFARDTVLDPFVSIIRITGGKKYTVASSILMVRSRS